jgi:hypothetical protein
MPQSADPSDTVLEEGNDPNRCERADDYSSCGGFSETGRIRPSLSWSPPSGESERSRVALHPMRRTWPYRNPYWSERGRRHDGIDFAGLSVHGRARVRYSDRHVERGRRGSWRGVGRTHSSLRAISIGNAAVTIESERKIDLSWRPVARNSVAGRRARVCCRGAQLCSVDWTISARSDRCACSPRRRGTAAARGAVGPQGIPDRTTVRPVRSRRPQSNTSRRAAL